MPMVSKYIGGQRSTAVWQLLGLVYLVTLYPIVLGIGLVGGLISMLAHVIYGLLFNSTVSRGDSALTDWSMRLFLWPIDQLKWIIGGNGAFPFLP